MKIKDSMIWITGASSGIGEELVYEAIRQGARVIVSARRREELERVRQNCGDRQNKVFVVPLDLTQMDGIDSLVKQLVDQHGSIDILINNGGISQRSLVYETPMEIDRRIMEVNYFGQVALTKAVLPYMMKQGHGHIAAISSLTGKFGFPLRSAYAASKHALHGFFETALLELHDKNIGITVANPGRIRTQISVNALNPDGTPSGNMDPGQEKGMPADECARKILGAIRKNQPEITIGKLDTIMVYFKRYLPFLFRFIAKRVDPR